MKQSNMICKKCKQRSAEAGAVKWFLQIPYIVMLAFLPIDDFCKECASSLNFLGCMIAAIILVFIFSLIVLKLAIDFGECRECPLPATTGQSASNAI